MPPPALPHDAITSPHPAPYQTPDSTRLDDAPGDWPGRSGWASQVVVVAPPGEARRLAAESVRLAGGTVAAELDWAAVAGWLADAPAVATVLVDSTGVAPAPLAAVLPALDGWARAGGVAVVATMTLDQVDLVTAALAGPHVQWLCDAGPGERIAALLMARAQSAAQIRSAAGAAGGVRDPASEDAAGPRLARLAGEVARIAAALTEIAGQAGPQEMVADRQRGWGAPPADPAMPGVTAAQVRAAIRSRRLRDQLFGAGWFEDPAWDMLLDLFAAELEGTRVSVSSLCIAAAVPPTTALRWLARMTEAGLIERQPDPSDRRRAFTVLSEQARGLMHRCGAGLRQAGAGLA